MKQVLIVDDTKNIRNLLTTCLEIEGYGVMTATNGLQALDLIRQKRFDLVFLDIKLPELSGTEVLRKMRESGDQTPVIVMTAFATVKNAVDCTKLGAIAYLQKPFTSEKVRNTLAEIMKSPAEINLLVKKAKEFMDCGKPDDAFIQLKKALAIDPDYGEIYYWLSKVYALQGNEKESERFAKIAGEFGMED